MGEQADGSHHKAEEVTSMARKMATLEMKVFKGKANVCGIIAWGLLYVLSK